MPASRPPRRLLLLVLTVALLGLLPTPATAGPAWVWPLPGPHAVSRPFALGATPFAAGHRGADLPGAPGLPVLAAGAGVVSYAGLLAGRGVLVVVHGALRSTYEPVQPLVGVGARVAAGQQIGTLEPGHPGCPVVACLHWGLLRGETYLDPVRLVEPGPVRLLPRTDPGAPAPPLVAADRAAPRTAGDRPAPVAAADRAAQPPAAADAGRTTVGTPVPRPAGAAPQVEPSPQARPEAGAAPRAEPVGRRTAAVGTCLALLVAACASTRRRRPGRRSEAAPRA